MHTRDRQVVGLDDEVFDLERLSERRPRGRWSARPRCSPRSPPADRPDERHRGDHPGRAGPDHPRRRCRACWWCRAAPAPARPRSRCTAPRTCSTPTATRSSAAACWSSGRTPTFLRYIGQVLPSLGETGVLLATRRRAVPRRAGDRGRRRRTAAEVKGDAADGRGAGRGGPRPAAACRDGRSGGRRHDRLLTLRRRGGVRGARERARGAAAAAQPGPRAVRHRDARTRWRRPRRASGIGADPLERRRPDWTSRRPGARSGASCATDAGRSGAALDELWPVLTPQRLLADLFGLAASALAGAAAGPAEAGGRCCCRRRRRLDVGRRAAAGRGRRAARRGRLARPSGRAERGRARARQDAEGVRPEVLRGPAWTRGRGGADPVRADLLDAERLADRHDEAELPHHRRAGRGRPRRWAFGHVIVDEAQELSRDGLADC